MSYNYRKGVIAVSKSHSVFPKMNKTLKPRAWLCSYMVIRSLFTNPDLPALKYCRTTEMEAANEFFDSTKKKHENLVITERGLFVYKTICYIGASPDSLLTCNCFEDACVEIKCSLSINYEKRNEENLD